ncbi:MAG TPA: hypothetical protein V6D18_06495 [Thermosynechococcaceae cyanobacterium]
MNFYPPHPSSTTAVLKHLQVLLVEDEPDIADLLTFILELEGANVVYSFRLCDRYSYS